MRRATAGATAALVLGLTVAARAPAVWAQARPDEQSMFGGPAAAPATPAAETPAPKPGEPDSRTAPPASANQPATPAPVPPVVVPPPPSAGGGSDRDRFVLGDPEGTTKMGADAAPENPLTIGGQLYLRAQTSVPMHTDPPNWSLTAPSLMDVFFDARPNDRVRAYILGRMSFDPTAARLASSTSGGNTTTGTTMPVTGFSTVGSGRGPNTLLDQMWIAFDIARKVFVTAGKQHVKWGTGHIWTPTDYLHPTKRNPLDVFDARGGVTMLRLQVPWEAQAWNFYGFAVFEDPTLASNQVGQVAGAARAELIILGAELGLDIFAKRGQKARFGVDLSTGLGDFDVYGDVGIRFGDDFAVVNGDSLAALMATPQAPPDLPRLSGIKTQAVAGVSWARKYNDNDLFTVGAEYFYNQAGYSDRNLYPAHLAYAFLRPDLPMANFFYLGRHYGALSVSLPAPYSWNYTTFTLSTLGNLSDRSFVTRLDYAVTVLTHLTFQAFAGLHYGQEGGELRFRVSSSIINVPTPLVDLGVALRLKF